MAVLVKPGKDHGGAGHPGRITVARDTRARMIAAAVRSLQHDGAEGMSFTDVLSASGAARGAIYHHFPGGKSQLVAEAATDNGNEVRAALAQVPAESPAAVVRGF